MEDTGTPKVRFITSETLGKLLPGAWAIEQSAGWYTAFLGDSVALMPCRSLRDALTSLQKYLGEPTYRAVVDAVAQVVIEHDMFEDERKGSSEAQSGVAGVPLAPKDTQ